MHNYYSVGKIQVQVSTNWVCELNRNFQHKMNDLFHKLEFVYTYKDNMLILTQGEWT